VHAIEKQTARYNLHLYMNKGVYTEPSSFTFKGNDTYDGIQIDLLLDRNDKIINLCEIKSYNKEFTITKSYAKKSRNKRGTFLDITKTKKMVFLTMLTTFGLKDNEYSSIADNSLTMDVLFQ